LDGDHGKNEIKDYLTSEYFLEENLGFKKYKISNGSIIIVLPEGECMEDLFLEFSDYINEQMHLICDEELNLKPSCPNYLTTVCSYLSHKFSTNPIESWELIEKKMRKDDDVKKHFWNEVKKKNYFLDPEKIAALNYLIQD